MRKDDSIARDLRIGTEEEDRDRIVKDSNGHQNGTSLVSSSCTSVESHHYGSGAETFLGFVGSPTSEDFECDPDWGNLAEGKGRSVNDDTIYDNEDGHSTFYDDIYGPSLLEEFSVDSHLGLGIDSLRGDGLDILTHLTAPSTPPCSLEYEGTEAGTSKSGSSHSMLSRFAVVNHSIPRHQISLTLVPEDMLSIYVREAASSWDLCS